MSRQPLPILPVLDLMHGQIVRGVAGRRSEYRPIISQLVDSAEPLAVAAALQRRFGFTEFYLADLDAIREQKPTVQVWQQLQRAGYRLWIDSGLTTAGDLAFTELLPMEEMNIIVGLESVQGPDELRRIVQLAGIERTIFSLDLHAGHALGRTELWPSLDSWVIADHVVTTIGVRRLIVLDLARVGMGEGVGTEAFCSRLKQAYPHVQLTAGGGVRGIEDIQQLTANGVDRVLVASALHDGRFPWISEG